MYRFKTTLILPFLCGPFHRLHDHPAPAPDRHHVAGPHLPRRIPHGPPVELHPFRLDLPGHPGAGDPVARGGHRVQAERCHRRPHFFHPLRFHVQLVEIDPLDRRVRPPHPGELASEKSATSKATTA